MKSGEISIANIKRHIRKCKKSGVRFNWLGFVENKDLTPEVESLFTLWNPMGYSAYDWVKGNKELQKLEINIS